MPPTPDSPDRHVKEATNCQTPTPLAVTHHTPSTTRHDTTPRHDSECTDDVYIDPYVTINRSSYPWKDTTLHYTTHILNYPAAAGTVLFFYGNSLAR
jgi:hypothetical protein